MARPLLVYCQAGNRRMAEIALQVGFAYGARLPDTTYWPLVFVDNDYRRPNRQAYMAALARERPEMATVLDWQRDEQLAEVLSWAEEAAQFAQRIIVIPKVQGGIPRIPRQIGGRDVVLGYSVPTRYGGTEVPAWEWAGWPIHLLGGSPHAQMRCYLHLAAVAEVVSADGNMAQKMATRWCQFWVPGVARYASNRWWPTLVEADGVRWPVDAPYESFRRSCVNIMAAWRRLVDDEVVEGGLACSAG